MASVAILAHRSTIEKGVPYDVPDFRLEEDRKKYENDYLTPFYAEDGTPPNFPCCSVPDFTPAPEVVAEYKRMLNERKSK